MAEIHVIRQGNGFYPASDHDAEIMKKFKLGVVLKAEVVQPRNYQFHKKLFSLIKLTFDYYEPPQSNLTEIELATVDKLNRFMAQHGVSGQAIDSLCSEFLRHLNDSRSSHNMQPDFDCFREYITIKARFYSVVKTPAGPKKIAKSISYASMDDTQFADYYRQVLNVCWQICLHKVFDNQERLAEELLRFE